MNKMKNLITNTGNYFSVESESSETSGANKGETAAPNRFFSKTNQAAFVFSLVLSLFFFLSLTSLEGRAATFTVNTKDDAIDANVGDGVCDTYNGFGPQCSLRAAIQEANLSPAIDDITFAPTLNGGFSVDGAMDLTLSRLVITSSMNIRGPGARALTVSARASFSSVFEIKHTQTGPLIVNISGITITGGRADNDGDARNSGGIVISGGTVTLTEVAVKNNAAVDGGGIHNLGGTLNLVRSTVSNNSAQRGGGINNESGAITNIVNSTISDNTATDLGSGNLIIGGGIVNYGTMTLVNSTVSHNTGGSQGGGIALLYQQTTSFINTIVAANAAANAPDVYGRATSFGNNLIGTSSGNNGFIDSIKGDIAPPVYIGPLNPRLGALQNNGGQTDTRALLAGSPALNAGNSCVTQACWVTPLNTDQRGLPRKSGASVDIGAFEAQTLGSSPPPNADSDNDGIPDICDVDSNPGAADIDRDGIVDSSACDTQIGPPVDMNQCKNGGWQLFNIPRLFRNQGDCIQFVNTGR